jgi:hypothetical protein
VSNFYGAEIKIWAGFGPVGNTEKKMGPVMCKFLRSVFLCFQGQKKFKRDMGKQAHALIWVRFFQFSTDFNEIFRRGFFLPGGLNGVVKFELAPLHSGLYFTN